MSNFQEPTMTQNVQTLILKKRDPEEEERAAGVVPAHTNAPQASLTSHITPSIQRDQDQVPHPSRRNQRDLPHEHGPEESHKQIAISVFKALSLVPFLIIYLANL